VFSNALTDGSSTIHEKVVGHSNILGTEAKCRGIGVSGGLSPSSASYGAWGSVVSSLNGVPSGNRPQANFSEILQVSDGIWEKKNNSFRVIYEITMIKCVYYVAKKY